MEPASPRRKNFIEKGALQRSSIISEEVEEEEKLSINEATLSNLGFCIGGGILGIPFAVMHLGIPLAILC